MPNLRPWVHINIWFWCQVQALAAAVGDDFLTPVSPGQLPGSPTSDIIIDSYLSQIPAALPNLSVTHPTG